MCGIAALYQKTPLNISEIKKMTDIIDYRGPDDEGQKGFFNDCFWLGHRRLAIVDLTLNGHQPMSNADGRYWITFNGEIYNFIEIKYKLKELGHSFKSSTDTEVILASYAEWGEKCLDYFNGMWSFVILDVLEKKVFAARDRFGVKPFYYSINSQMIGFSSEIKQLLAINMGNRKANREEVAKFLIYGEVNINRQTCFEGIKQLLPGEALSFYLEDEIDSLRIWKYYNPPVNFSMIRGGAINDFKQQFSELFTDAVRLRMRSDVSIGSCLSGGIDSSSIVIKASQLFNQQNSEFKQKTFTSCFSDPRIDEWNFAEQIVKNVSAESYRVFPNMDHLLNEINSIIWHQEEPFRSTSIYAQWNVMRLVHENGIKVLLDGQGADEIMAGYHYYIPFYISGLLKSMKLSYTLKSVNQMNQTGIITATDSKIQFFLKSVYYLFNFKALRRSIMKSLMNDSYLGIKRTKEFPTSFQSYLYQEINGSLQSLLRHEDRNSMAFSIEARTPFLDYRLVELFLQIPGILKLHDGWTKPFLREEMNGIMPDSVRLRVDKKGFDTPERDWYEKNIASIKQILLSKESPLGIWIDLNKLNMWMGSSKIYNGFYLWRLLSVYFWMKRFSLN